MTFVITRLCRDCVDQSCVSVCPVDCILEPRGEARAELPNQLYIEPIECIGCGLCAPECPWEAIFEDEEVPALFEEDIALNALTAERPEDFAVPEVAEKPLPSPEQVQQNQRRWGYDALHR